MSLNGDLVVMRNGRSTSQISVYNYPEHLNPFYEDDQHKRLRFWRINKKGDGERRNSFSISGLKDIWTFKSFRMKKRSSTLGINKTSESPPPLRRNLQYDLSPNNTGYSTYDGRSRYSANNNVNGAYDNNFLRNATYRSSLQNVHTTTRVGPSPAGFGFRRNDQYRSTTQFPGNGASAGARAQTASSTHLVPQSRRYVYRGSVTPQPIRNSEIGQGFARGSSQASVNTNPFETDDEEELNGDILTDAGKIQTSTPVKHTPRKKRRAPPPPALIHKVNNNDVNVRPTNSSQQNNELHIEENLNIANLTAEIESFVKTSNTEGVDNSKNILAAQAANPYETTNGAIPRETVKTNNNLTTTTTATRTTTTKIETKENNTISERNTANVVIVNPTKEEPTSAVAEVHIENKLKEKSQENLHQKVTLEEGTSKKEPEIGHVECIHIHVESPRATPERNEPSKLTSFRTEKKPDNEQITAKTSFTLTTPSVPRRKIEDNTTSLAEKMTPVAARRKMVTTTTTTTTMINEKPIELKITKDFKQNNQSSSSKSPETSQLTTAQIKPPIASKPNFDTKFKSNNFAMIHKSSINTIPNGHVSPVKTTVQEILVSDNLTAKMKPNEHTKTVEQKQHLKTEEKDEKNENASEQTKISNSEALTLNAPLKIIEPKENILTINETTSTVVVAKDNAIITPAKPPTPPVRHVPLRAGLTNDEFEAIVRAKPNSHMEWKKSTLAPLETNVPPEKRKSVKDIIESINRSQRLLNAAANKEQMPAINRDNGVFTNQETLYKDYVHISPSDQRSFNDNNNLNGQININYSHSQCETQPSYDEIAMLDVLGDTSNDLNETGAAAASSSSNGNEYIANNDPQKPNNADIFTKCRVTKEVYEYRESSPTTSNLDWNPVPKPKRTKNLSELHTNE